MVFELVLEIFELEVTVFELGLEFFELEVTVLNLVRGYLFALLICDDVCPIFVDIRFRLSTPF